MMIQQRKRFFMPHKSTRTKAFLGYLFLTLLVIFGVVLSAHAAKPLSETRQVLWTVTGPA